MQLLENIKLAFRAIRSNLLRTVLTILIIAFGIIALVGILTAIDVLKFYIHDSFSTMGANTFNIRNRGMSIQIGKSGRKAKKYDKITFREAMTFKERYSFAAEVSISTWASAMSTIRFRSKKTHPNVSVYGADEKYLLVSGLKLAEGRNFSEIELFYASDVVILGKDVKNKIFESRDTVLGSMITIGNRPYRVIGVLKEKGVSSIFSPDNIVIIPLNNARKNFHNPRSSFVISVNVEDVHLLNAAIGEAQALFRNIRGLRLTEEDNFEIIKSDSLANTVIDMLSYVGIGAILIGLITLLGAAVGLMNILLVAVSERTREIGVCKAIGATAGAIRQQFLVEALVICQLGGVLGIVLGILAGWGVAVLIGGKFIIPWMWIIMAIVVCLAVGISAGIYPALKAARLHPIEALRYE